MASDEDYAAFLEKANQDTGVNTFSTSQKTASAKAINTEVPPALQEVEAYYISEADEPFEPVSLKWDDDGLPSEEEFKDLIDHQAEVSSLSTKEFDPRGQYEDIVDAVKRAGSGEVKVFRVHHGRSRAEYYVVSLDEKGRRVVGLKAVAVET